MTRACTTRLGLLLTVAGCLIGLLLAAYVGGYFVLGERLEIDVFVYRDFPAKWLYSVYRPAAKVEARLASPNWSVYLRYPGLPGGPALYEIQSVEAW